MFANMNMNSAQQQTPADTRPPEERFASQLEQLKHRGAKRRGAEML